MRPREEPAAPEVVDSIHLALRELLRPLLSTQLRFQERYLKPFRKAHYTLDIAV